MKTIQSAVLLFGILIASLGLSFGQTNLRFTGVNATLENAIQLHWASTNHELYAIQCANAFNTNADGSTAWSTLYDQYPSQGTNTFIGDFGNYNVIPAIPHPKYMPMRFYRVVDEGADNDTTDNPSITITSPTNGSVLTGQITVLVTATCTNLPIVTTTLYVDGQEMNRSDDGSNYLINTCEWWNGSHTLFSGSDCSISFVRAKRGLSGLHQSRSFLLCAFDLQQSYFASRFQSAVFPAIFRANPGSHRSFCRKLQLDASNSG